MTRLAKHGVISGQRHGGPGDPTNGQSGNVRCSDVAEERACSDGTGDTEREIYCYVDAGAVEELASEGVDGNSEQDEDDD